jgi:hypothetical protein
MAPKQFATLALAVLLAATVAPPPAAVRAAMSCNTVYNTLMPCLPFVQMGGNLPTPTCCGGIRSLLSQAGATADRRTICGCLKNVAARYSGSTYITRAASLPSKCGVNLPYKISGDVNCNTYVRTRGYYTFSPLLLYRLFSASSYLECSRFRFLAQDQLRRLECDEPAGEE